MPAILRVANADTYPSRPLRVIVGFSPGSTSDLIGRLLAKEAAPLLGQQLVVENKSGAVGAIAAQYVAHAANDGYTALVLAVGTLTNEIVKPTPSFDVTRDFAPIALLASGPFILVTNAASGINSVAELIALAKSKPGEVLYGSVGGASVPHLTTELFAQRAGIQLTGVTYPGGPQIMNDLLAGRITMGFTGAQDVMGQVVAGKLKALATTAQQRSPALPGIPTMTEAGIAGLDSSLWTGLLAPAGTPRPVIEKLAETAARAMHAPDTIETLQKLTYEPLTAGPEQFAAFLRSQIDHWSAVARGLGVKG